LKPCKFEKDTGNKKGPDSMVEQDNNPCRNQAGGWSRFQTRPDPLLHPLPISPKLDLTTLVSYKPKLPHSTKELSARGNHLYSFTSETFTDELIPHALSSYILAIQKHMKNSRLPSGCQPDHSD